LKTPTEEIWPGVTQLPDYKATFPNWIHNNLTSLINNIEEDGLDLLQVKNRLFYYCSAYQKAVCWRLSLHFDVYFDLEYEKIIFILIVSSNCSLNC
jgi:hypothetical protein